MNYQLPLYSAEVPCPEGWISSSAVKNYYYFSGDFNKWDLMCMKCGQKFTFPVDKDGPIKWLARLHPEHPAEE